MTEDQFWDLVRNLAGMDDRFIEHSNRELLQSTLKELRADARALLNKETKQ